MDSSNQAGLYIAVGSSAGGLEALISLLSKADTQHSYCFIIAQHLDPNHSSMLTELLARSSQLPVITIQAGMRCELGRVYVTPPGFNASLDNRLFNLLPADQRGPKPSADSLFESIALEFGEQAVGVILSGTGTDGAKGISAIKESGGLTVAQDDSAKYSGMPEAAIETGNIDIVCPPGEMVSAILARRYNELPSETPEITGPKAAIERIFNILLEKTGQDFSGYKLKTVNRRLERRMKETKVDNIFDYISKLESSEEETDFLLKEMLISVTSFFREPEAFAALKIELLALIHRKGLNSNIRVWIPGCATGEEAFTIAMLLEECASEIDWLPQYQIFATDLDEDALRVGRRGAFMSKGLEDLDKDLLEKYFFYKDGYYQIHNKIREKIIFARQNVVSDPPFSRLDLISCRNLLIYFGPRFQRRVATIFHYSLLPHGLLMLGKSESFNSFESCFEPLNKRHQLYRRLPGDAQEPGYHRSFIANILGKTRPVKVGTDVRSSVRTISTQIDKVFNDYVAPPCVVINANGDVVHFRGDVSTFMRFPQGKVDFDVLNLVDDDLKMDLHYNLSVTQKVGECRSEATSYNAFHKSQILELRSKKIVEQPAEDVLVAIFFNQIQLQAIPEGSDLGDAYTSDLVQSLQRELKAVRNHLDISINELEVTNEELQSSNEELQSANEELQSSNEELQTSNEELQSANEELSTLNEELEVKSGELFSVNHDLELILLNVGNPVVLLDARLRLLRFTHQAGQLLGLTYKERGETLTTLGLPVMVKGLREKLLNVIETGQHQHYGTEINGRQYNLRILPHKAEGSLMLGVMMVFEALPDKPDCTELLNEILSVLELHATIIKYPYLILDDKGGLLHASVEAMERIPIEFDHYIGHSIAELFPVLEELVEEYNANQSSIQGRSHIASCVLPNHQQLNFSVEFSSAVVAENNYIFIKLLS
jgi:two-component system CheB/CheR fusion protein